MKIEFDKEKEYFNLFDKNTINIENNITILIGCNGSGKTTLLNALEKYFKSKNTPYCYFKGTNDDNKNNMLAKKMIQEDYKYIAKAITMSEGENMALSLSDKAFKIGEKVKLAKSLNKDKIFVLIDSYDSGTSIDELVNVKKSLKFIRNHALVNDEIEIFFIISTNQYELAENEDCIYVKNMNHYKFNDYNDYKKFILDSNEDKLKRYDLESN